MRPLGGLPRRSFGPQRVTQEARMCFAMSRAIHGQDGSVNVYKNCGEYVEDMWNTMVAGPGRGRHHFSTYVQHIFHHFIYFHGSRLSISSPVTSFAGGFLQRYFEAKAPGVEETSEWACPRGETSGRWLSKIGCTSCLLYQQGGGGLPTLSDYRRTTLQMQSGVG